MKRYGFLLEKVTAWENLRQAAEKAARGKKSRPSVARFLFHLEPEILRLQAELKGGSWTPEAYHKFRITDPKPRTITAADFRDRVVHHALMNVLDPLFERHQISRSYACRRGKGTHAAVRYAQRLARRCPYFLKGDVDRCFETIDRAVLKTLLRRMLKDPRLLAVLDRIIDTTSADVVSGCGLPIGNLTSQYFANHYLGQLDQFVKRELKVRSYVRYMDDFLLFGFCKAQLQRQRAALRRFLADRLRLCLKEKATWLAPTREGVPFLGFRVFPGTVRLQSARWRRMARKIRRREAAFCDGRLNAEELARSVRSSIAHVQHAATLRLRRRFFVESRHLG